MSRQPSLQKTFSCEDVARHLGKCKQSILDMIKSGELAAIDTSSVGAARPIYRIEEESLQDWKRRRSAARQEEPPPVQRRSRVSEKPAKQYF